MIPPIPVVFEPILQPRPWGGRRLADLFGKALPAGPPIGESWELASLPGAESRVREGPLGGRSLGELVDQWGERLIGSAALVEGRFPLLIKFLDARETLSVQVHPRRQADASSASGGVKNEAWYIIDAAPGAELLIGAKPGVSAADFAAVAGTSAVVDLLQPWPAKPGRCYYLPSGVPHALGAGVVVAEVQTPLDVTYRLYDWDRLGLDGKPRPLHVADAIANLACDTPHDMILQPRSHAGGVFSTVSRLVMCESFLIDKVRLAEGATQGLPHSEMIVWIVLDGAGGFAGAGGPPARNKFTCTFKRGDVVLIPADSAETRVQTSAACEVLEVKLPIRSPLADFTRPDRDIAPARDAPPASRQGPTQLKIRGK